MKKKILIVVVAFALGLNVYFLFIKPKNNEQSAQTNTQNTTQEDLNPVSEQKTNGQPKVEQPTQNPTQEYDIASPSSLSVIVNKTQPQLGHLVQHSCHKIAFVVRSCDTRSQILALHHLLSQQQT